MLGLRERKKFARRQRIQEAALELFGALGFQKTTIALIAEASDLAVGTIYNYFKTKEDILFAIIEDNSKELYLEKLKQIIIEYDGDTRRSLRAFIEIYYQSFSIFNNTIWGEFTAAMLVKNMNMTAMVKEIDKNYLEKFCQLITTLQKTRKIRVDVEPTQLVSIIHHLILSHFILYISRNNPTAERFIDDLTDQIHILLLK